MLSAVRSGQRRNTVILPADYNEAMRKLPSLLKVSVSLLALFALCTMSLAAKDFAKPAAQPAKTYPAHDDHPAEGVAVAADPYDMPDKAQIFSVNYRDAGFLPIFLVVTNDSNSAVSLADMEVQMNTASRAKLTPLSSDDIYRRLTNPSTTTPLPLPIPRKKVKGTLSQKEKDEIENAQFAAKLVEPHSTQSGFLFFDVSGISAPLAGAHLYLTGLKDTKGNELMYFEIALEKYLSAPQKP